MVRLSNGLRRGADGEDLHDIIHVLAADTSTFALNLNKELYVFWGSLMCLMYFSFLFINTYIIKSKNVTIGVFQELLTIPFMLGSLVLLVFALKFCISSKFSLRNYSLYSLLILNIVIAITWGSFFV